MKILFSVDNFDHGEGGAEKSTQTLSAMLAGAGHEATVLQTGEKRESYQRAGATVHFRHVGRPPVFHDRELRVLWQNHRWRPLLEGFLNDHPADLIFTQHRLSPATVAVARRRGVPVVSFVRAYSMFCPSQFRYHDALAECERRCFRCLPLRQKLKDPLVRAVVRMLRRALEDSDLVVANSDYVRRVVERFCRARVRVLSPPVVLESVRVEREAGADRILFIKPQEVKGLSVFASVARAMPEQRFLVAGKLGTHARQRLAPLPNVECMGWVHDMREAYRRTRVLFGPSLWPEPFGRVFVEAAASGIPAVASKTGGIPEAVGDGGLLVEDRGSVQAWLEAFAKLKDPALYDELSRKARTHAEQFAPERLLPRLRGILKEELGLDA